MKTFIIIKNGTEHATLNAESKEEAVKKVIAYYGEELQVDEERYNNELEYIFDGYTESLTLKEFKKTLTFKRYNKKEKYKFANLFKAKRKKLFKN